MHSSIQFRHEAISTYCWRRLQSLWLFRSHTLLADSDMYEFFFTGRILQMKTWSQRARGSALRQSPDRTALVSWFCFTWSVSTNWCHKVWVLSVTAKKRGRGLEWQKLSGSLWSGDRRGVSKQARPQFYEPRSTSGVHKWLLNVCHTLYNPSKWVRLK